LLSQDRNKSISTCFTFLGVWNLFALITRAISARLESGRTDRNCINRVWIKAAFAAWLSIHESDSCEFRNVLKFRKNLSQAAWLDDFPERDRFVAIDERNLT
jgi:hypothetical protein